MWIQAFAWFSDLLVEHAEIFWSLFAVDMDRVLAEQPADTWDSFPLFQILNDYLRTDGTLFSNNIETDYPESYFYRQLKERQISSALERHFCSFGSEIRGFNGIIDCAVHT